MRTMLLIVALLGCGTSTVTGAGGGLQSSTVTLTEAILVGTSAGQLGHADGVPLVPAPGAGKRLYFEHAIVRYTFADAAYTACTTLTVRQSDGTVYVQLSESIASHITAANSLVGVYTHNDNATTANGTPASVLTNVGLVLWSNSTACTNGASANGTATITVYYRILDN